MMLLLATCLLPIIAAIWEDLPDESKYSRIVYSDLIHCLHMNHLSEYIVLILKWNCKKSQTPELTNLYFQIVTTVCDMRDQRFISQLRDSSIQLLSLGEGKSHTNLCFNYGWCRVRPHNTNFPLGPSIDLNLLEIWDTYSHVQIFTCLFTVWCGKSIKCTYPKLAI